MSIYFIRHDKLIKIGFSSSLKTRVAAIVTGVPGGAVFLGHMPGDRTVEAHLHAVFAADRFNGEWFIESEPLLRLIEIAALKELPVPEPAGGTYRKRLDNNDAWRLQSERLRTWAAHRWPELGHRDRLGELQHLLPFSPRRVRALYHYEAGQTLRVYEMEALDEYLVEPDAARSRSNPMAEG